MTTKRLLSQRPANAAATTTKAPKGRTDLKNGCNTGTLTLPSALQHIGDWAFRNCNFTGALNLPAQSAKPTRLNLARASS